MPRTRVIAHAQSRRCVGSRVYVSSDMPRYAAFDARLAMRVIFLHFLRASRARRVYKVICACISIFCRHYALLFIICRFLSQSFHYCHYAYHVLLTPSLHFQVSFFFRCYLFFYFRAIFCCCCHASPDYAMPRDASPAMRRLRLPLRDVSLRRRQACRAA